VDDLGLDARILEALRELGIEAFTEPQRLAIPRILAGANVLLVAPTGIGKTEAAVLPILHRILSDRPGPIACLYITPLRALNRDMLRRIRFFEERLGVRVAVRHGDTSAQERARITKEPPDILITTPETLQAILPGKAFRRHLHHLRFVIIDEVHHLVQDRRGTQLAVALERLLAVSEKPFQRIGLSATVGDPNAVARFFGGRNPLAVVEALGEKRMEFPAQGAAGGDL